MEHVTTNQKTHWKCICKGHKKGHTSIKHITLFPDWHSISLQRSCGNKEQNDTVETRSSSLETSAESKQVLCIQEAHQSHPIGPGVAGFAQKMHQKLQTKFVSLRHRLTNQVLCRKAPQQFQKSSKFWETMLCTHTVQMFYHHKVTEATFQPTTTSIMHVNLAKKTLELSKLDQEIQ